MIIIACLEIIALAFLCVFNGQLAETKRLTPKKWWLYTVLAWLTAACAGALYGIAVFGMIDLYAVLATSIFFAFGGYLFIRNLIENKPDIVDEDVERISVDDLRPPKL